MSETQYVLTMCSLSPGNVSNPSEDGATYVVTLANDIVIPSDASKVYLTCSEFTYQNPSATAIFYVLKCDLITNGMILNGAISGENGGILTRATVYIGQGGMQINIPVDLTTQIDVSDLIGTTISSYQVQLCDDTGEPANTLDTYFGCTIVLHIVP